MNKKNLLKLIGGLCFGAGIGVCVSVAMNNIAAGILLGIGIGMCNAVALGAFKKEEK